MKTYCVYAYKPASEDYCRGCTRASYDSFLIKECHIEEKELFRVLVEIKNKNSDLRAGEDGYESCDIFISEDLDKYDYDDNMDSRINYRRIGDFLYSDYREANMMNSIRNKVYEIIAEQKEQEKQERLLKEAKIQEEKIKAEFLKKQQDESNELALFKKLKQKYANV